MDAVGEGALPIDEAWLHAVGFRWHQLERQPAKHWLLWLGDAVRGGHSLTSYEDLGIEVANGGYPNRLGDTAGYPAQWFCWLRSDGAGRYHRFIHLRHLKTRGELVHLVEGITGFPFDPANHFHGSAYRPDNAARLRAENDRLDRQMNRDYPKWAKVEEDDSRGRALPEHMQAAVDSGKAS